jgi:hypothetical protein
VDAFEQALLPVMTSSQQRTVQATFIHACLNDQPHVARSIYHANPKKLGLDQKAFQSILGAAATNSDVLLVAVTLAHAEMVDFLLEDTPCDVQRALDRVLMNILGIDPVVVQKAIWCIATAAPMLLSMATHDLITYRRRCQHCLERVLQAGAQPHIEHLLVAIRIGNVSMVNALVRHTLSDCRVVRTDDARTRALQALFGCRIIVPASASASIVPAPLGHSWDVDALVDLSVIRAMDTIADRLLVTPMSAISPPMDRFLRIPTTDGVELHHALVILKMLLVHCGCLAMMQQSPERHDWMLDRVLQIFEYEQTTTALFIKPELVAAVFDASSGASRNIIRVQV